MRTNSIFTPPPKSTAAFLGGSFVSLKAVAAVAKSTMHPTTKFLITCPPIKDFTGLAILAPNHDGEWTCRMAGILSKRNSP
jgi:hypothetical protein